MRTVIQILQSLKEKITNDNNLWGNTSLYVILKGSFRNALYSNEEYDFIIDYFKSKDIDIKKIKMSKNQLLTWIDSRITIEEYLQLEYKIILNKYDEDGEGDLFWDAYCEELGRYSCYGIGKTPQKAIEDFNNNKRDFIEFLYNRGEEIPYPNNQK